MEERKRILLLGGTGTIGLSLAPELKKRGFDVFITSRSAHGSNDRHIIYLRGNAKDDAFLDELLAERFDAIVDFMIYTTEAFRARCEKLLSGTSHYIFLSSYRVYGDSKGEPITEQSPRLLDSVDDPVYLETDEYGLTKARQEDILRASGRTHFTIIRPAITYGGDRFQLGTMEANEFLNRVLKGKPILFPRDMAEKQATMTWAGDVGRMIARLVLNESAFGETYTAATAEHHSWGEVLEIYRGILTMQVKTVSLNDYQNAIGRLWQIKYDRMLDRVVDNTKILEATGMRQSDLMPLSDGLRIELGKFLPNPHFKPADEALQKRIDEVCTPKLQPNAATASAGSIVTFRVETDGPDESYQWQYSKNNGAGWVTWNGKTADSVSTTAAESNNGCFFRCLVTNRFGSLYSKWARLTVSDVKPNILTQPKAVTAAVGTRVTFSVVAGGAGVTYQWQYSKNNGESWITWNGKTSNSVSATAAESNNGCLFRCLAENSCGSVTSACARLTVSGVKPNILTEPMPITATIGTRVTFKTVVGGSGITYQWQYSKNNGASWVTWNGKTSNSVSATAADTNNRCFFRCLVKNDCGGTYTKWARLIVLAAQPEPEPQPQNPPQPEKKPEPRKKGLKDMLYRIVPLRKLIHAVKRTGRKKSQ